MKHHRLIAISVLAILQAACGGGGGSSGTSQPTAVLSGTVPGTLIEAFGDNGSYYAVNSTDNGTSRHPFTLQLPAGVGFRLVMTTNEGTPQEVVTPLGFRDPSNRLRTRLVLGANDQVDLGHVPLYMSRNEAAAQDLNGDGVLDAPLALDDMGANNPLLYSDADNDGVDDWDDSDHGGYAYGAGVRDPQDQDGDGIPNRYDPDYNPSADDPDRDGLPTHVDANPRNDRSVAVQTLAFDSNGDGYLDDDLDHDGFHDDDLNRDGYHDDDLNHDGYHDDDRNHDGKHDEGDDDGNGDDRR